MFGLAWLSWYLAWLKAWLRIRVDVVVKQVLEEDSVSSVRRVNVIAKFIYPSVRAAAYMAWWGQVMFEQFNAADHGVPLAYVPSMPGVSPKMVEQSVREEVRPGPEGAILAPVNEIVDRMASRIESIVPQTARETTTRMATEDPDEIRASVDYTKEHGHPLSRFEEMLEDENTEVGRVFDENPDLRALHDTVVEVAREENEHRKGLAGVDRLKSIEELDDEPDGGDRRKIILSDKDVKNGEIIGFTDDDQMLAEVKAESYKTLMLAKAVLDKYEAARIAGVSPKQRDAMTHDELAALAEEKLDELWEKRGWRYFYRGSLKFARIAVGVYTCGFCLALCARGAVYRSDTALTAKFRKRKGKKSFVGRWNLNAYHEHCDCLMVAVHDEEDYPGKDIVDAAKAVYEASDDRDLAGFSKWLKDPEVQKMVREKIPYIDVTQLETWEERTRRLTKKLLNEKK